MPVTPAGSVALAVAVCAPAAANECCTDAPVAVAPSSNTHVIAPGISCGSESVAVALNVIAWPWPAVAGAAAAVTSGAARWYSKAPMSRRAVPSPLPSTRPALERQVERALGAQEAAGHAAIDERRVEGGPHVAADVYESRIESAQA